MQRQTSLISSIPEETKRQISVKCSCVQCSGRLLRHPSLCTSSEVQ